MNADMADRASCRAYKIGNTDLKMMFFTLCETRVSKTSDRDEGLLRLRAGSRRKKALSWLRKRQGYGTI